jgi:hypothetical protein
MIASPAAPTTTEAFACHCVDTGACASTPPPYTFWGSVSPDTSSGDRQAGDA